MTLLNFPFRIDLNPKDLSEFKAAKTIVRRLSDMPQYYQDQAAVASQLKADDPVIYRFWEIENQDVPRGLSAGVTTIYPGTVGAEYYMTKGHFHTGVGGDEIYLTLSGKGKLFLFSRTGDHQELDMLPGSICYIPSAYAHRTVNTGDEDFTFAAVWPPAIPHDYESILCSGFPILAVKGNHGAELKPNPTFSQG